MTPLTLDAGALIAVERRHTRVLRMMEAAWREGLDPIVPTVALGQVWRSPARQAPLNRALVGCVIEPLSDELARAAGALCGVAGTSDLVDAAVVAHAARHGGVVVTSDPADLLRLVEASGRRLRVVPV